MHKHTLLYHFLPLLLLYINTTGSMALFTEDHTIQTWDNSSTHQSSNNPSSVTTIGPQWINNQSSAPPLTKVTQTDQSTREPILYITGGTGEDYYEDYTDDAAPSASPETPVIPCTYDRCKHMEPLCEETQGRAEGNCLCPGIAGPKIIPDVPRLGQIIPGVKGVSVSWCSPMSTVHGYKVLYGPPDGLLEQGPILNASYRFYSIEGLLSDTTYKVCLVAFNKAGESLVTVEEHLEREPNTPNSCTIISTTSSKDLYIYIGIGVGLATLVGLLGLSVFGCWMCYRRKASKESKWYEMESPY
ncbi:LRRN4 C-terminal-like protein [Pelodytes ibericus]